MYIKLLTHLQLQHNRLHDLSTVRLSQTNIIQAKIADFGHAKKMRNRAAELHEVAGATGGALSSMGGSFSGGSLSTVGSLKGTRLYLAPELLEYAREVVAILAAGRGVEIGAPYSTATDIW